MLVGEGDELLLSDFGIALIAQSSRYQGAQDMAGTISYMAPEQIKAHPRPASDQYSLGVIVYEWLCGEPPFQGSFEEVAAKHMLTPPPSLTEKLPTISPMVEHVVMTALAKDPKDRFGSIKAFANALEQASLSQSSSPEDFKTDTSPQLLQKSIGWWLDDGDQKYRAGRYADALAAYEQVISLHPFHTQAFNKRGDLLCQFHRYEQAIASYEQALRLDSHPPQTYSNRGDAFYYLYRYKVALEDYEQALQLDANLTSAYLGIALTQIGRYQEALEAFEHAIQLDPNESAYHNNWGDRHRDLQDYASSLVAYEQACLLEPGNAMYHHDRGMALYSLAKYKEAVVAHEQAIERDPNYAAAYNGEGDALTCLGRYEEAEISFEQGLGCLSNTQLSSYRVAPFLACNALTCEIW
jgi:tetratricopeptide (TPR) repeat protein